ncbi:MAG TPA: hypothetical protein PKN33_16640 [Phycisphaerae bacterium]|nr:hypothetical protein [Phycisphaerae bacterium]
MISIFKLACGPMALAGLVLLGNLPSPDALDFDTVNEAVRYAEERLGGESDSKDELGWSFPGCGGKAETKAPSETYAALVVRFEYSDENKNPARLIASSISRNGSAPIEAGKARVLFVRPYAGQKFNLRFAQRGYHAFSRDVEVRVGEVTVVDDIVLERATRENGASLIGRLWLEGRNELEGITIRLGEDTVETGPRGEFKFEGVPSGNTPLNANVDGFLISPVYTELKRGKRSVAALKGYGKRVARVRWAYQPEKSRDLSSDLEGGETILETERYSQFSFATGLKNLSGPRDFTVRQEEDKILIESSSGGTGMIRLTNIRFDEVMQAPDVTYERGPLTLKDGDIFVFKTSDGEHFAKLEVIEIVAGNEAKAEALSELARQPLDEDE